MFARFAKRNTTKREDLEKRNFEAEEKVHKRNRLIIIFVCFLIIFSTITFRFLDEAKEYNPPVSKIVFPQVYKPNFQNIEEEKLFDFQDSSIWKDGQLPGRVRLDNTTFVRGESSLLLTTNGDGVAVDPSLQNIESKIDLSDRVIKIWIKFENIEEVESFKIEVSSDNFESQIVDWELVDNFWFENEYWTSVALNTSADLSSINSFKFLLQDKGEWPVRVWLGAVTAYKKPENGFVSFAFNDFSEIPINKELKGSLFVESDFDLKKVAELKSKGWDIGCKSSKNLTEQTPNQIEEDFLNCKQDLYELKLVRDGKFLFFNSNGGLDQQEVLPLLQEHFSASLSGSSNQNLETFPPANVHNLSVFTINQNTSFEQIKSLIDKVYEQKGWLIFVFEDASKFQEINDYLNQKKVPIKTFGEIL